ncbi:MAG: DeoR/GlpR family DNA-binding transcription regulator [Bacteroidales bacterium]|nr:DeoR/GlpR family DNA-binding transcription regulator [Bacteroidales bacterium]
MALNQRRIKILDMIKEDGHAKVQTLSKIFGVSEVTIRQDLEALEQMDLVQREHGGAFLKDFGNQVRMGKVFNQSNLAEKQELAKKAASLIKEGDIIILDSGSTTTEIAKLLVGYSQLTVITNAINIAGILGENPGITLIVTGGEFKAPTLSLTGEIAANTLKNLHASKLFLATAGISPSMNLTYPSLSDLIVKQTMIEISDTVYLVADSHKIGVSAFATLGSITLVDALITDKFITEEDISSMMEANERLEII